MGPETPEILRENSEQPLDAGSPLHSLGAAAGTGHSPHRAAQSTAAVSQRLLNPHTRCRRAPPAVRGLPGPRGSEPGRDPGAPRLGPCPEQPPPPAPRPRPGPHTPALPCPAGGRAAPGPAHRARLRSPRHRPFGRSRTPSAPRPGRAAPARPRGAALGPEGPRTAAHHGGGCAGLSPPGSGGH